MNKEILNNEAIRDPLLKGMKKLASIVKTTLGPGGRTIILERAGQALDGSPLSPKLTKDGVSVAEECADKDRAVNVVIQTVKNICKKTNKDAGDGTTTAIVLGEAILNETQKELDKDKDLNPQLVKESLEKIAQKVIALLKEKATPVQTNEMIQHVATISANGDQEIGEIIAAAFDAVGAEGVVTVDEGATNHVTLDVVDGYQFNRGAQSRDNFFNTNAKTHFEVEDQEDGVAVILYDGKLQNFTEIIPVMMKLADVDEATGQARKKPPAMVFVANEFSRDVLQFLLIQKEQRGLQICCIQGPHTTHVRTGYYDDLACYTGGVRFGNGAKQLTEATADDIGRVERVIIDKYKTTFYDGFGTEEELLHRVDQLNALKLKAESPYDAQVINDRIAALTNGVAKIAVGGATELEIKEKYDRIEDALNAARSAIQEGIVPGGGATLLKIAEELNENGEIGERILKRALQAPITQILNNIGIEGDKVAPILALVKNSNDNLIYNARNRNVEDAIKVGVVDPVKVTRSALSNAISIAGLLSTTGGAIIYNLDK